jgi:hypothetical protein
MKHAARSLAALALVFSGAALAEAPHAQLRVFAPGGIAIDWEHPNDGARAITVERENPAFTWTFADLVSSFNDLGLSPGTNYRYRVCAVYAEAECTPWIAAQTQGAAAPPANPGAPNFTSSSATPSSITVSWYSAPSYSFHNIRWAENGHGDGQQEVKGRTFTAGGLRPGDYHFIVQGCNTTLLGSSCGKWSAPIFVSTMKPLPPAAPPVAQLSKGVIYAVTLNDDLMWYRHDGRGDGSLRWAAAEGRKIGQGWEFKQLFANAGYLYGIKPTGELMWYHHLGREDGTFRWEEGKQVGTGWASFAQVFSGGDGIIYAIEPVVGAQLSPIYGQKAKPASGGRLLWYRHVGQKDGSFRWEGPKVVGTGWGGMRSVFYGGDGIVYALQENGDLMWGRHLGRNDGTFRWEGLKKVGNGWGGFTKLFAGGDGVIYAIKDNGELLWYRHDGRNDGSFRWAAAEGKNIGSGWYKFTFKQVFTD